MLLIVAGIVLLGLGAVYLRVAAATDVFGRRLVLCTAVALVGIVLMVVGAVWTSG